MNKMTHLKSVIHKTTLTTLPFISGLLIVFGREIQEHRIIFLILSMICLFIQLILVMRLDI